VDRAVFGVVFLLVFAFSYSEEIVTGLFEAVSHEQHELWRYAVIGLDVLIMSATGLLKRSIARSDGRGPRLWAMVVSGGRHRVDRRRGAVGRG
jgi:hypothetical protein